MLWSKPVSVRKKNRGGGVSCGLRPSHRPAERETKGGYATQNMTAPWQAAPSTAWTAQEASQAPRPAHSAQEGEGCPCGTCVVPCRARPGRTDGDRQTKPNPPHHTTAAKARAAYDNNQRAMFTAEKTGWCQDGSKHRRWGVGARQPEHIHVHCSWRMQKRPSRPVAIFHLRDAPSQRPCGDQPGCTPLLRQLFNERKAGEPSFAVVPLDMNRRKRARFAPPRTRRTVLPSPPSPHLSRSVMRTLSPSNTT